MNVIETDDYRDQLSALPNKTLSLARVQVARLKVSFRDPRLHTKKLVDMRGVYSFRITREYRALFYFSTKSIILFAVGHRKDIYSKS